MSGGVGAATCHLMPLRQRNRVGNAKNDGFFTNQRLAAVVMLVTDLPDFFNRDQSPVHHFVKDGKKGLYFGQFIHDFHDDRQVIGEP